SSSYFLSLSFSSHYRLHSSIASLISFFFFFNHPATSELYTLSLHDALPILATFKKSTSPCNDHACECARVGAGRTSSRVTARGRDRKSTRLNSSHVKISYAVFCLKKKKKKKKIRNKQTKK